MNIGVISGGRAPNVIPDLAVAEISIRLVANAEPVREAVQRAIRGRAELREILSIPAQHFDRINGFETSIVAYTTDVPVFGDNWGKPFLLGPGSIHVAHTSEERVPKKELLAARQIYQQMVNELLARP